MCSLKLQTQILEIDINFLRSELQEKNVLIKYLLTSHMFHENVHVPNQNVEINPCISSRKIVLNGNVEIC